MQATVVALYGEKSADLSALIDRCQSAVSRRLGSRFRRYAIRQVHATLVGLERDERRPERFLNRNYAVHRLADVAMDFGGLIAYLRRVCRVPLQVQIGGFQDRDYPFTSRGARPFDRCFSLQGGNVVVIGWPRQAASYPDTLQRIRLGAQRYGVLHAYHRQPDDADNDCFFRIGILDDADSVGPEERAGVQQTVRNMLGSSSPGLITIDSSSVSLAFYETEELSPATTRAYALSDERLDDVFVRGGY